MFDAVRFWLGRGVDGFRLDVAHYIMKDSQLRDNPPNPDPAATQFKPMGDYDNSFTCTTRAILTCIRSCANFAPC